jgi:hypothetical protein
MRYGETAIDWRAIVGRETSENSIKWEELWGKNEEAARKNSEEKVKIETEISGDIHRRLMDFCSEQEIEPSIVVERALEEYFHMGDIGH